MTASASLSATDYLAAFTARRECCRALIELSAQQSACIEHDDYSELLALLEHKQQLLDELWDAGRNAPPLWQTWRNIRDGIAPTLRAACDAVLAETDDLLRQVLTTEASSSALLIARRDAVERQLCLVNQAATTESAYRGMADLGGQRRLDVDL
jgi:hypothetical protein